MDFVYLKKLKRALWISLLNEEKYSEAIHCYNEYIKTLINNFDNEDIEIEKELFQKKIIEHADNLMKKNLNSKALILYDAAFNNIKDDINLVNKYIYCLECIEEFDLALILVKYAQENLSCNIETYKLTFKLYEKLENYSEAIKYLEKYINEKSSPEAEDYNILGFFYDKYYTNISQNKQDMIKSLEAFSKASDLAPYSKLYAKNTAVIASYANQPETAGKYWNRVLSINQMSNIDKFDYSLFCIKQADFYNWNKYYDARFLKEHNAVFFPEIKKERWDGSQDLSDSTLLIHWEQGFGDTFLMWGYMPRLIKLAKHIIFIAQGELYDLIKDNEYGIEVISRDEVYISLSKNKINELDFDYYIPAMSIPGALKLDRTNISVIGGYIKPKPELVEDYRRKYFNNTDFKIGISYKGAATGDVTRNLNISEFLPLDDLKNIRIYNLTKNITDEELKIFKQNKVVNISKYANNFSDTAAIMANCDLIITSDNCILNLAGALGNKTYALFNWSYAFRYFDLSGENIVWFKNVKPFICDDINNWQSVIKPVIDNIKMITS